MEFLSRTRLSHAALAPGSRTRHHTQLSHAAIARDYRTGHAYAALARGTRTRHSHAALARGTRTQHSHAAPVRGSRTRLGLPKEGKTKQSTISLCVLHQYPLAMPRSKALLPENILHGFGNEESTKDSGMRDSTDVEWR